MARTPLRPHGFAPTPQTSSSHSGWCAPPGLTSQFHFEKKNPAWNCPDASTRGLPRPKVTWDPPAHSLPLTDAGLLPSPVSCDLLSLSSHPGPGPGPVASPSGQHLCALSSVGHLFKELPRPRPLTAISASLNPACLTLPTCPCSFTSVPVYTLLGPRALEDPLQHSSPILPTGPAGFTNSALVVPVPFPPSYPTAHSSEQDYPTVRSSEQEGAS